MRIFMDVDGTLTVKQCGRSLWKVPWREDMIAKCKELPLKGHEIIIWTGNTHYARRVALATGIPAIAAVGKPQLIVDNEAPRLRRRLAQRIITPEEFLKMSFKEL